MKLAVLYSGGKDSNYAMYKAMEKDEVVCIISIFSKNKESYMFHTPNIELVRLQAMAMETNVIEKETEGVKEEELVDLKEAILKAKEHFEIEGIVTGAVKSEYQASRIEKICDSLGLWCYNPLWHVDEEKFLYDLIDKKFKVIISGVFADGLGKEYLGKVIDKEVISSLVKLRDKFKISPAGEGGEIETTVLDAPFFKKKIDILDSEIKYENGCGVFLIKNAKLSEKN